MVAVDVLSTGKFTGTVKIPNSLHINKNAGEEEEEEEESSQ